MTERDLENLKHLDVPPVRAEAKRAAMDAALAAFERSSNPDPTRKSGTQENAALVRPMRTINRAGSFRMGIASRQNMAIAASLAALVIAAPIAFKIYENEGPSSRSIELPTSKPEIDAKLLPADARPAKTVPISGESTEQNAERGIAPEPSPEEVTASQQPAKPDDRETGPANVAAIGAYRSDLGAPVPAPSPPPPPLAFDGSTNAPAASASAPRMDDFAKRGAKLATIPDALFAQQNLGALSGRSRDINNAMGELPLLDEPQDAMKTPSEYKDHDVFDVSKINPIKQVATDPVSTFSVDVDTASYAFARRALNSGHLPPKGAVRVEEMINYFPYAYPAPETAGVPFKPTVTVMPAPWKPTDKLVHIAIKGYDLKRAERPRANLVFLLDVSGSMESEDRLPLVKNALRLLVDQLQPDDTVGIVTYASGSGIALEPTKASDKQKILSAIDKLDAGGSTDGADGIADAYRLAEANFDKAAVNRIILATDGDFNVGVTDRDQLKSLIERKRATGIYLSILGVGQGNHNDALMQALAQNGNGTAAYVDTLNEARKVLVDEASSTLFTIAKDVKAQVEWNPARVSEYRLIGYETRALQKEDFNNDQVDAGDIGSGHTVTAIYEITPVGAPRLVDDLRYGKPAADAGASRPAGAGSSNALGNSEFGFLKLRYKKPSSDTSELISLPITDDLAKPMNEVSQDVRFSVAVAAFGDLLRGAPYEASYSFDDVIGLAQTARGDDPFGYRAEFLNLARLAKSARP